MLDTALLASIAQQMMSGDTADVDGKQVAVRRTSRHRLRTLTFTMGIGPVSGGLSPQWEVNFRVRSSERLIRVSLHALSTGFSVNGNHGLQFFPQLSKHSTNYYPDPSFHHVGFHSHLMGSHPHLMRPPTTVSPYLIDCERLARNIRYHTSCTGNCSRCAP